MVRFSGRILLTVLFLAHWPATAAFAQQPETNPTVVHVLGLENTKRNTKGRLSIEGDTLRFATKTANADVPIRWIEDIFTRDDSRQVFGGPLAMLVPYGGGRLLGLFRRKVDALTVEYRDSGGALHGVIFTLPEGRAAGVKTELVARGAHASILAEEPEPQEADTKANEVKKQ